MNVAVTDAAPCIHLAEIDALALLQISVTVYIPDAVWFEITRPGRIAEAHLLQSPHVQRWTLPRLLVSQFRHEAGLEAFQAGDVESLCLCQTPQVSIVLTDDLAVREAAKRLALTPVGSLGIVVRAYHRGHIVRAEAERCLQALYDISSLFVTRTIVELAMAQLHRSS